MAFVPSGRLRQQWKTVDTRQTVTRAFGRKLTVSWRRPVNPLVVGSSPTRGAQDPRQSLGFPLARFLSRAGEAAVAVAAPGLAAQAQGLRLVVGGMGRVVSRLR